MKKIVSILLGVVLIFSTFAFVGCNEEEKDEYEMQIHVDVLASSTEPISKILTPKNPRAEVNVVYPCHNVFLIPQLIKYNKTGNGILSGNNYIHQPNKPYPENMKIKYTITDEQGNEKNALFNTNYLQLTKNNLEYGYIGLEKELGRHRIEYTVPASESLGTEETTFELIINFINDPDKRKMYDFVLLSDNLELLFEATQAGQYDVYKQRTWSDPNFSVIDAKTGEFISGIVEFKKRKIDEAYVDNPIAVESTQDRGLYFCEVYVYRAWELEEYQEYVYQFYIML